MNTHTQTTAQETTTTKAAPTTIIVGETTCDGKKKMYELLGEVKNVYVMQLPQRQTDEASQRLWRSEVRRFKEKLEGEFGVSITDEKIREAIRVKNEERLLLQEIYRLGKMSPPPMTGLEQLKVLYGAQFFFDPEERNKKLRETIDKALEDYERGERKVSADKKRILITGCPLAGATEKIVTAIEESGGVVVCYENCVGAKSAERLVETSGDPYDAIADRYLQIGCSVMTPNANRFELLRSLIKEFKVDGVVEMTLQACHTYAVETYDVRKAMKEIDIPFISVETDYSNADVGQLKTRLGAFVEMLS